MFWAIILLFSLFTAILFGVGGYLISHWWFKPKNNPDVARIYVEGIDKPFIGKLSFASQKGTLYIFRKGLSSVIVPQDYGYDYHYYKRTIYLDSLYNLIAIPRGDKKPLTSNAKNELIQELVTSHIGAEAIHAIKSRSSMSITLIIVAIIIAIGAGVVGYAIHKPTTITQSIPAISQPQNIPQSGEIKIEAI